MKILMMRRDNASLALPLRDDEDAIARAAELCDMASPGFHNETEWCVVDAEHSRFAKWPET